MSATKIRFNREKETPGAVRFKECTEPDKPPTVGTLYVRKWSPLAKSGALAVTIAPVEKGGES